MKRSPLLVFYSVIIALYLREVQVRFGSQKLGYLWAIIDASSMIFIFSFLKVYLMGRDLGGVDYTVFLTTSFLSYNLFKVTIMKSMDAFDANKALFVYKQVKPFDSIVARSLLEITVTLVVSILFILLGLYLEFDLSVENFPMVIFSLFWFILFAIGLGVLFSVISSFYNNFKKIVKLVFTPMLFISALFYTVESLPPLGREIILYNPVVHFMEMIHGNYFFALDTYYVDYKYIFLWTFIPLFIGLWMYRRSEEKILST